MTQEETFVLKREGKQNHAGQKALAGTGNLFSEHTRRRIRRIPGSTEISETQDTFCNGASDREGKHRENGTAGEMRLVF